MTIETAEYTTRTDYASMSAFANKSLELFHLEQPKLSFRASHQDREVGTICTAIKNGGVYDKALGLMQTASAKLATQKGRVQKPQITHHVQGSSPSVGRAVTGNPRNMHHRKLSPAPNPLIKVACSIEASCNVGADEIANRAAAVLSVLRKLESENKRVQLSIFFAIPHPKEDGSFGKKNDLVTVALKKPEQRLSVRDLSWLGNENFLRGLAFCHFEHSVNYEVCKDCYGQPQKFHAGLSGFDVTLDSVLGMEDGRKFESPETALEEIEQQFAQQLSIQQNAA